MMDISENISYGEATKSQLAVRRGIDNTPNSEQLAAMVLVAENCFEPLRLSYGLPIGISSFFRSVALNKAVGGSKTSQHTLGEAIDIDADIFNNGITNAEIFMWLRTNVNFDQLIKEGIKPNGDFSWVHVSFSKDRMRKECFEAKFKKDIFGKTQVIYEPC